MIKALIIEDETKSRELLQALVTNHCKGVEVVASADNVKAGVAAVNKYNPDLIFLDISMPDGTGFDLLEKISPLHSDIIFTTATDKYAIKAIKYSALDYLLKPIDAEELKQAVERLAGKKSKANTVENLAHLLQNLKQGNDSYQKITIPTSTSHEIILIKDIIRCEADGSYTTFHLTGNRKLMASGSLKHYEDLLPVNTFMRIHHHHLINTNQVVRYLKADGGYAVMSDGSQIEISRRKKEEFLAALNKI